MTTFNADTHVRVQNLNLAPVRLPQRLRELPEPAYQAFGLWLGRVVGSVLYAQKGPELDTLARMDAGALAELVYYCRGQWIRTPWDDIAGTLRDAFVVVFTNAETRLMALLYAGFCVLCGLATIWYDAREHKPVRMTVVVCVSFLVQAALNLVFAWVVFAGRVV